ncbi:MAG: hypothetical protein AAB263_01695 [Planctomycetota bacterium]
MADPVAALLELWTIDQRRRELATAREARLGSIAKVEADWKTAEAAAVLAASEADKIDALIRQYTSDAERCDKTIAELSAKKLAAKSNKEYMEIHNGIEQARAEKTQRELSVKETTARKAALVEKMQLAADKAAAAKTVFDAAKAKAGAGQEVVSPEEAELTQKSDHLKASIDPEFLHPYEKLVKSGHKQPLMRVDPKTRSTPFGGLLSHNQVEQIRQGKLVIDRATNSIMYIG